MNLDEDEASVLFGDERESRTTDDIDSFHVGITFDAEKHVVVYTDDERFAMTRREMESMLDECEFDSIWAVIDDRLKFVEYVSSCEL